MKQLNLPAFAYKIQTSETGYRIFDVVRKKYVKLTPEEWVRQHVLHYLVDHLAYPKALVRLEKQIPHYTLRDRPDIVVYNRLVRPFMLVECKAPDVSINNQEVWRQVGRYNTHFKAQLLVITNGLVHFCWQLDHKQGAHRWLPAIPHCDRYVDYCTSTAL
ncbi:MAG: type I restriction enzyme HsdR N-terminal domain-containing protein [Bacteroidota bacterium]